MFDSPGPHAYNSVRMASKEFKARLTSKNQLTLPAGISALLHVGPGDDLHFSVADDGTIRIGLPPTTERLGHLIGRSRRGKGLSRKDIDTVVRELRGPRDE